MRFRMDGQDFDLDAARVRERLRGRSPEPLNRHWVEVDGRRWPPKQVLEAVLRVDRTRFTSQTALRQLRRLEFSTSTGTGASGGTAPPPPAAPEPPPTQAAAPSRRRSQAAPEAGMPEATAQGLLVSHLVTRGWTIHRVADTGTRERGIDVLAGRADRTLAVEVKGYPGRDYADPRRAAEPKATAPATQARHWYAQAVLKAMLTREERPDYDLAIALPDRTTYRRLHENTRASLETLAITVYLIADSGAVDRP